QFTGLERGGLHRRNDPGRFVMQQYRDGCTNRGSGRQADIDQDHCTTMHMERRTTTKISTLAPRQLLAFLSRHSVDYVVRNTQISDDWVVEDADIPSRDSAHCQLFVARDAELANDKDIQQCVERAGYFIRDGDTAAR